MASFKQPFNSMRSRDYFSPREVGLTHPDNDAFVKLSDNGSIEIMAGDDLGIIIDPHTRTINIYGDSIRFHTREIDGLRWNRLSFNSRSTKYTEPTFTDVDLGNVGSIYDGIDTILDQ